MRVSKQDKEEAIKMLRKLCPPGTTILCILEHVSRSGMTRHIKFYNEKMDFLSGYMSNALEMTRSRRGDSLVVTGCGMDMGFSVVYTLSYVLHGDKDKGADAIASSGHPFKARRGHYRAGYSLSHRWL